jgi:hypothetical protein
LPRSDIEQRAHFGDAAPRRLFEHNFDASHLASEKITGVTCPRGRQQKESKEQSAKGEAQRAKRKGQRAKREERSADTPTWNLD